MYTVNFTEIHELLGHIPADSETTEQNTGFIYAGNHHRFVTLISVGDMATNATFDVDIEQATNSAGSGTVKNVTGKSITQLTQAGSGSNKVVIIELRSEELDVAGGFDHFNVECTPATAAVEFSVMVFGFEARYRPVSTTSVEEIKA